MSGEARSSRAPRIAGVLIGVAALALAAVSLVWQTGAQLWVWPTPARLALAALALSVYAAWTARALRARRPAPVLSTDDDAILVVHASQTGTAERLAQQTAAALRAAGRGVRLLPLGQLEPTVLAGGRALFVVSTTGEGDAPDSAYAFVRRAIGSGASLGGLRYGVLALGDRRYASFCAFGHALDHWLRRAGAQAMFDLVEVDDGDPGALRHWQQQLGPLTGHAELDDWQPPQYARWRLVERERLNPESVGGAVFRLALQALDDEASWQAGDIAEIGPRNAPAAVLQLLGALGCSGDPPSLAARLADRRLPQTPEEIGALRGLDADALAARLPPLPHREYSIASLPQDGKLELLVRQMRDASGRLGHGSGWLTEFAPLGGEIALRIRANPGFRLAVSARPLILIGNGTGIAGLRAHLKARLAAGQHRNWLLFGERQRARDFFFGAELEGWLQAGRLAHLDLAFSRDQDARLYVQQRLREQQPRLRAWLADGAEVLVCGSLDGMAPAVDAVLRETLGDDAYDAFVESGRYRRDVY
ncbi:sulfite reductase subunit alpha [Solimonas variicoloris]|uniref:sulfite reductase subunit alpha n=1 Tax=Solimonas variicoloris TaxID=254408 RepID=UPI00035DA632|nr:sulfite reductase subunit alpha [Solimonas variicoloris]